MKNSSDISSTSLWLKTGRIFAIVLTLAAVTFISVMPQIANDFWLQAKIGELIVQDGAIPKTVLFPFTPIQNATFNAHEWLPSVVYFALIKYLGESNLPLVLGATALILFGVMVRVAHERSGGNLPAALILGLLAIGAENYRNLLRPELFSLSLLGIYWHLLDKCRKTRSPAPWAGALLVVVVWANTHGSFVLAPLIAAIYAAGMLIDGVRTPNQPLSVSVKSARPFGYLALAALACTVINPFGFDLLKFVFEFSGSSVAKAHITEWFPTFDPRLFGARGWRIGLAILSITAIVLMMRWRHVSAIDALIFVLFAILALNTVRFLVYTGMVAAYVLAPLVPARWNAPRGQILLSACSALAGATVLGLAMTYGNALGAYPHRAPRSDSFTAPMIKELNNPDVRGNVLNSYDLGAELVFRAYPRIRPTIDSRIDSYGDQYAEFFRQLWVDDEHLTKFINQYDVRYMLLVNADFGYLQKLPNWTENHWEIRFRDQRAVLLQRRDRAR